MHQICSVTGNKQPHDCTARRIVDNEIKTFTTPYPSMHLTKPIQTSPRTPLPPNSLAPTRHTAKSQTCISHASPRTHPIYMSDLPHPHQSQTGNAAPLPQLCETKLVPNLRGLEIRWSCALANLACPGGSTGRACASCVRGGNWELDDTWK